MKYLALSFFALLFMGLAGSCAKESLNPDYPFSIQVKTLNDSVPQQNILVEVLATPQGNLKTFFSGYTDENGVASFEYDANANFTIRATKGSDPITFIGCTTIRLMPDERVTQTVYLEPYDQEVKGCDLN